MRVVGEEERSLPRWTNGLFPYPSIFPESSGGFEDEFAFAMFPAAYHPGLMVDELG
jgi:hypothetical protein